MTKSGFDVEVRRYRWTTWRYVAGGFGSLKKGSPAIPCRRGVYVIRAPKPLSRVRGACDVIYIGQSGGGKRGGRQGIGPGNGGPGRLFNTRGADKTVRERIESLFPGQQFSLACTFVDQDDPKVVEERLLSAYLEEHTELPPANHSNRSPSTLRNGDAA
jgi:hypothetical protein